jgi:uncharacterized protein YuzE
MALRLVLTGHLWVRLAERWIPLIGLKRVAGSPNWTEPDPHDPGVTRAFGRIKEAGGKILRVAYADGPDGDTLSRAISTTSRRGDAVDARDLRSSSGCHVSLPHGPRRRAPEVARTEEVAPGLMLDFDRDGRVIGIEMLSVSQLPGAKPMQMAFEILQPSDAAAAA